MKRTICFTTFGLAFTAILATVSRAEELTEERFRQLHRQFQRAPADEPWRTIPWKIDLLDAQNAAARENKPIFIWAMDGHPLGCT